MSGTYMRFEESLLASLRRSGTDDPTSLFVHRCPDHDDQAATDEPDGDKPVLDLGVILVEDFQIVVGTEDVLGLIERDAVFSLVRAILGLVPQELHSTSVRLRGTKSMAYSWRSAELHSGAPNLQPGPQPAPV